MAKIDNLGKECFLKTIKLVKTWHCGQPHKSDRILFTIVKVVPSGYFIQNQNNGGNIYFVKSKDIEILE